jgi:hypothetical protein
MMTKPQTRLRVSSSPGGKQQIRFHLVREGEPVPEIAPPHILKSRRRKHAAPAQISMEAEPHCPLCDVTITRFDTGVYDATGHCGPCHEALEE